MKSAGRADDVNVYLQFMILDFEDNLFEESWILKKVMWDVRMSLDH